MINNIDREFINILRGASVLRVVLVHLGLGWFFLPYSSYIGIFFPTLFFVSGAVSYNSFQSSTSKGLYLFKRCRGIMLPFFIFMLPVAVIFAPQKFSWSYDVISSWLLLKPSNGFFPFPIGQIWFITCLLVIACITFPLFIIDKKFKFILPCGLGISMVAPTVITYEEFIAADLAISSVLTGYLTFEVLSLIQFFLLGACYIKYNNMMNNSILLSVGILVLIIWLSIDIWYRLYQPAFFSEIRPNTYLFQSLAIVLILLGLKDQIITLLQKIPKLKDIMLHCNKHAYSIFIIHIPILYFIENMFGWQDLSGNIVMALARLGIVLMLSLILCIPLTKIHTTISSFMDKKLGVKQTRLV